MLTDAEVVALIRACSARASTGVRNRALIAVLGRCGLRVSEALGLELRDVDLDAGTVRVRHGKGDRRLDAQLTDKLYNCTLVLYDYWHGDDEHQRSTGKLA